MKVRNYLTEKNWVPHCPVPGTSQECLVSAISKCYGSEWLEPCHKVCKYLNLPVRYRHMVTWNDLQTSFAPVKALIEELDI